MFVSCSFVFSSLKQADISHTSTFMMDVSPQCLITISVKSFWIYGDIKGELLL